MIFVCLNSTFIMLLCKEKLFLAVGSWQLRAVQATVIINKRFQALRARCHILAVQHPIQDWGRSLGMCVFLEESVQKS
jgi:hypothetical protein